MGEEKAPQTEETSEKPQAQPEEAPEQPAEGGTAEDEATVEKKEDEEDGA